MEVFWGIGKKCEEILKKERADVLVDSDKSKVGTVVQGMAIQDTSLVKDLSEKDTVYITTQLYQDEVYEEIKGLNSKVVVKYYKEVVFRNLDSLKKGNEKYRSADKVIIKNGLLQR